MLARRFRSHIRWWALTPRADDVILGDGEDDVAVGVVFDLGERTLVAGEQDRSHGVCGV